MLELFSDIKGVDSGSGGGFYVFMLDAVAKRCYLVIEAFDGVRLGFSNYDYAVVKRVILSRLVRHVVGSGCCGR